MQNLSQIGKTSLWQTAFEWGGLFGAFFVAFTFFLIECDLFRLNALTNPPWPFVVVLIVASIAAPIVAFKDYANRVGLALIPFKKLFAVAFCTYLIFDGCLFIWIITMGIHDFARYGIPFNASQVIVNLVGALLAVTVMASLLISSIYWYIKTL